MGELFSEHAVSTHPMSQRRKLRILMLPGQGQPSSLQKRRTSSLAQFRQRFKSGRIIPTSMRVFPHLLLTYPEKSGLLLLLFQSAPAHSHFSAMEWLLGFS